MMIAGRKLLAVASCVVAAVAGCSDSRTTPGDFWVYRYKPAT